MKKITYMILYVQNGKDFKAFIVQKEVLSHILIKVITGLKASAISIEPSYFDTKEDAVNYLEGRNYFFINLEGNIYIFQLYNDMLGIKTVNNKRS